MTAAVQHHWLTGWTAAPADLPCYLVTGTGTAATVGDSNLQARLGTLGFTVTLRDDDAATPADDGRLVVLAESVAGGTVLAKYTAWTGPVITLEYALADDLGLATSVTSTHTVQALTVTSPLAGLPNGTRTITYNDTTAVNIGGIATANLAPGAVSLATVTTENVLIRADTGAARSSNVGGTFPGRRVMLGVFDRAYQWGHEDFWDIFDTQIQWLTNTTLPVLLPLVDDFTGQSGDWDGAKWQTPVISGSASTVGLVFDRGRIAVGSAVSSFVSRYSRLSHQATDVDITGTVYFETTGDQHAHVIFRASGDLRGPGTDPGYPSDGYILRFNPSGTTIYLEKMVAGTRTTLATGTHTNATSGTGGGGNKFRIRVVGSNIKIRTWRGTVAAGEPTTWQIDTTDTSHPVGGMALMSMNSTTTVATQAMHWDNIAVASPVLTTPEAPTLTVQGHGNILLTWPKVYAAATYDIQRNGVTVATGVIDPSYGDHGLTPSTLYTYAVRANDSGVTTAWSGTSSATTDALFNAENLLTASQANIDSTTSYEANLWEPASGTWTMAVTTTSTEVISSPSMRVTRNVISQTNNDPDMAKMGMNRPAVTAGTTYTARLEARMTPIRERRAARVIIRWYNAGSLSLGDTAGEYVTLDRHGARVLYATGTAPVGAVSADVFFASQTQVSNDTYVYDRISLHAGTNISKPPVQPPSYVIFTKRGHANVTLTWPRIKNASSYAVRRDGVTVGTAYYETGTTVTFGDKLLTSGTTYAYEIQSINSVETSAWSASSNLTTDAANMATNLLSSVQSYIEPATTLAEAGYEPRDANWTISIVTSGNRVIEGSTIKAVRQNVAGTDIDVFATASSAYFPVRAGLTYTARMEALGVISRTMYLDIEWYDASQVLLSTSAGTATTVSAYGVYVVSNTATAPTNAAFGCLVPRINSVAYLHEYAFDRFSMHRGTALGPGAVGVAGAPARPYVRLAGAFGLRPVKFQAMGTFVEKPMRVMESGSWYPTGVAAEDIEILRVTSGTAVTASATSASFTPVVGAELLVVAAMSHSAGEPADSITVSGLGATWTQVATSAYAGRRRVSVWRGVGAAGTGTLSFTHGQSSGTPQEWVWIVDQFVDPGGTINGPVLSAGTGTGGTVTNPATPTAGAGVWGFVANELDQMVFDTDPSQVWWSLGNVAGSNIRRLETWYSDEAGGDTFAATWVSSAGYVIGHAWIPKG